MPEKVLIIGAGIAGLSTGCYLQMNGYETEIHELHNQPGGLCTSWKKNGYTIDGCIHWLVGSAPGESLYTAWNELIDMKKLGFFNHGIYYTAEDASGNSIVFYNNIDRLEQELLEKAPEDRKMILKYVNASRRFSRMKLPLGKPKELYTLADGAEALIKLGPYMGSLRKWSKISIREFAAEFRNPLLRKTMENLFVPEMSVVFAMITTAWMHNGVAGYPIGGSLNFARLIGQRYQELGGRIVYNSRIEKINTRETGGKHAVTGITNTGGADFPGGVVVSAADGYSTLYGMLEGRFTDPRTEAFYKNGLPFSSYLQLSLGVGRKLHCDAAGLVFPLSRPVRIDPSNQISEIGVKIYSFDPGLAPEGSTLVTALIPTREDEYWCNLRTNDYGRYKEEKTRITAELVSGMEHRLGPLAAHLEMQDLSTPATVVRYTNNWKGSFEGWIMTPGVGFSQLPNRFPGLKNFYMAGQWVSPGGGLPSALLSGRGVAALICRQSGKKFRTSSFSI